MRLLSIIAHPRPASFCYAISERARGALVADGHDVTHHDLYAENFDPCLTADEAYSFGDTPEEAFARTDDPVVRRHRVAITEAEGLLVVHPTWWGKPPAILSGWLDRVLVPGVAYRLATPGGLPEGLLSVRSAVILNTSDTPPERENKVFGDPLDLIWGRCVLPFCGVRDYRRRVFRPIGGSSDDQRAAWLDEATAFCHAAFSVQRHAHQV